MVWIEVHQTLPSHRKLKKLKRLLKIKTAQAVGHMVMLWLWAIDNAPDGNLSQLDPEDIAEACEWTKDAGDFVQAIKEAGFIDDDMRLHDWDDYTGLLMSRRQSKREKDRDRQRRYREKQKCNASRHDESGSNICVTNGNVTRDKNVSHATNRTVQYSTVQNSTVPNHTEPCSNIPATAAGDQPDKAADGAMPGSKPQNAFSYYQDKIGWNMSREAMDMIPNYVRLMGDDVVIAAIDEAIDNGAGKWGYIKQILQSWTAAKVHDLDSLARYRQEWNSRKSKSQQYTGYRQQHLPAARSESEEREELRRYSEDSERLLAAMGGRDEIRRDFQAYVEQARRRKQSDEEGSQQ